MQIAYCWARDVEVCRWFVVAAAVAVLVATVVAIVAAVAPTFGRVAPTFGVAHLFRW